MNVYNGARAAVLAPDVTAAGGAGHHRTWHRLAAAPFGRAMHVARRGGPAIDASGAGMIAAALHAARHACRALDLIRAARVLVALNDAHAGLTGPHRRRALGGLAKGRGRSAVPRAAAADHAAGNTPGPRACAGPHPGAR